MEISDGEAPQGQATNLSTGEQYHYALSSYDPNMCSARFSPGYTSASGTEIRVEQEQIDPASSEPYNNVILVHCNETESNERFSSTYTQHSAYVNYQAQNGEIQSEQYDHTYEGVDYIHQIHDGINEVTGEPITAQILLHRSPNGHIYQNYYVANDEATGSEIVELVRIDNHVRRSDVESLEYGFHHEIEHPHELIEHTDEFNAPLTHANDVPNPEVYADSYVEQAIPSSSRIKDQQRILLESTMSPLLAAVNDITQRDAELQSYLNQNLGRDICAYHPSTHTDNWHDIRVRSKSLERGVFEEEDDYLLVSDRPVESRALASLPTKYLFFGRDCDNETGELVIYAKKDIPHRTKFGPLEGEIRFASDVMLDALRMQTPRYYPLLLIGETRMLDVSNKNTSNWMRYVRMAENFGQQNLLLIEEDGKLFFKCCRNIRPKDELRVGYSEAYANYYGLQVLPPSEEEKQQIFESDNPWPCYECDDRFPTSNTLQNHLAVHDVGETKSRRKSKSKRREIQRILDMRKNSSRCIYCGKVFMTVTSLRKHLELHLMVKRTRAVGRSLTVSTKRLMLKCAYCYRRFRSEERLKNHQLTHTKNEFKPHKCPQCDQHCATPTALAAHIRSHSSRLYSCVYCQQCYKHVLDFKNHVSVHMVDGVYYCYHCKRKYLEYHLVRKHIRIFHPAVKYPCNECGRQFQHISFLRRHKAIHSEKKDFLCADCGRQFRRKDKLKEHVRKVHENAKPKADKKTTRKKTKAAIVNDGSQYLKLSPKKSSPKAAPQSQSSSDYRSFDYKCDECQLGFKRRGILVNHMVKRHPDIGIETVPDLNAPIIKVQSEFQCDHCSKVYKSNAKRKAHILKNHPGKEVPPSLRGKPLPGRTDVRLVGSVHEEVQKCEFCYKQYASRNRLLAHYRKSHPNIEIPEQRSYLLPSPVVVPPRPETPENKLLKLSSAALELSSIEDRKYFDFLNERSEAAQRRNDSENSNYKFAENELTQGSSNSELSSFPQLFEGSMTCI